MVVTFTGCYILHECNLHNNDVATRNNNGAYTSRYTVIPYLTPVFKYITYYYLIAMGILALMHTMSRSVRIRTL